MNLDSLVSVVADRSAVGESLFRSVDSSNPIGIVHLSIKLSLGTLGSVNAAEVGRAPHLVGVHLIRAPVLVPILSRVDAIVQGVASFKAQFFVPSHLATIAKLEHFDVL